LADPDVSAGTEAGKPMSTADLAAAGERASLDSYTRAESQQSQTAETAQLLPPDQVGGLRNRWDEIQASFVDEPRGAVERADSLVAEAIKMLAETFASERANLEGQWDRGEDVSTEDLRVALQRYRAFFGRLLAI
jgi:hypothetical protein